MFTIDDRIRVLPAVKEQVVALHQSINSPQLGVPGRQAGPAQAFIVGLRGQSGFGLFVYLFLPGSGECAVYASDKGTLQAQAFASEEAEALGFTESMGFMMDTINFRQLSPAQQEELLQTLPPFQRQPTGRTAGAASKSLAPRQEPRSSPQALVGRVLSAY